MNNTIRTIALLVAMLLTHTLFAQDSKGTDNAAKKKRGNAISLGHKGLKITKDSTGSYGQKDKADSLDDEDALFESHWVMMGLGFNAIQDKTDYNSAAAKTFLNVPDSRRNAALFDLRRSKSVNVDIYPFMETLNALKTKHQRINISTGIGLQLYNFSYQNPVSYVRNPKSVVLDTISFKKNKLAFDYLTVPLMITFKTKLYRKEWLIYSIGVTEGYNINAWTKQQSSQRGKVKSNQDADFATFSTCLTAEIGITDVRFYATYQATNLYSTGLEQHPFSVGIRFFGI